MNSYELSRKYFDWSFDNPELVSPNLTALYFFIIEHCNRLGWKKKFGLPAGMAKDAIGVNSYNTYIKIFNQLVDLGFIEVIERSKNQYSATIIALSDFDKANHKKDKSALSNLDKASVTHQRKHSESTIQSTSESIYTIDKHITNNNGTSSSIEISILECRNNYEANYQQAISVLKKKNKINDIIFSELINDFDTHLISTGKLKKEPTDYPKHFASWINKIDLQPYRNKQVKSKPKISYE